MFLFSRLISRSPQLLATLVIFSLASGVLGGLVFYLDTATPGVLSDMTSGLGYDMEVSYTALFYSQNTTGASQIEDLLMESVGVQTVNPVSVIDTYTHTSDASYSYTHMVLLGVERAFLSDLPNAVTVTSPVPQLTNHTCYMERTFFEENDYHIGDNFTAEVSVYDYQTYQQLFANATYDIAGTFETNLFPDRSSPSVFGGQQIQSSPARNTALTIITTKNAINTDFAGIGFGQSRGVSERYWATIDHSKVIHGDINLVYDRLDSIRRQFEQRALPYAMVSSYGLREAVVQFQSWSILMTTVALAFSVPTIVMGVLLVYYNSNLMSDETRKDIGTIKTRGASGRQAFSWIVSSAIITGLLGSLGAIGMGILAAYLSGAVEVFFVFNFSYLSELTLVLTPTAIASVFIFSFGVGILVAFPIALKSFLMTSAEAHSTLESEVLLSREKLGNPSVDLVVLATSAYLFFYMLIWLTLLQQGSIFSGFFLSLLVPIVSIMVVSFARFFSRPAASTKSAILKRMKRPSLFVGARVMSRTLLSFKKSEAMGVVFISMVFTAGVLSTVSAFTAMDHTDQVFKFYTGADVTATVKDGLSNVTLDLLQNITSIDGVESACPVLKTRASITYYSYPLHGTIWELHNESVLLYAVDPDAWKTSAFWMPYFTFTNPPDQAISLMMQNDTCVLSSFRPIVRWISQGYTQTPVFGDHVTLELKTGSQTNRAQLSIVDVLSSTEGAGGTTYLPGEPNENRFIAIDLNFVQRSLNTSMVNKFLIKMKPGADYKQVMSDVYSIAPSSFQSIESPYTGIDRVRESKAAESIYGVYTLNVLFAIVFLSIGMAIVVSVRMGLLRKQLSVMRALGTESGSIRSSLFIDTLLSVLIAAVIGVTMGFVLASFSMLMPLVYIGKDSLVMWNRLPILLAVPLVPLGLILGISVSFALIASLLVTRSALRKNIAEEIQYAE